MKSKLWKLLALFLSIGGTRDHRSRDHGRS